MEFVHGDSNGTALTGAGVFPHSGSLLPALWCRFCWDVQPAGYLSLFQSTRVYFILRLHRGVCHGSIPACHRNYCNTAGRLMIIISLGLSYHYAFFVSHKVSGQNVFFVIKLKCSICFFGIL